MQLSQPRKKGRRNELAAQCCSFPLVSFTSGGIYALFEKSRTFALQDGKGADDLTVVAIVTLADPDQFGLAPQPQQAREAAAAIAPSQSKPESPKPVEEKATEAIAKEIPKQAK